MRIIKRSEINTLILGETAFCIEDLMFITKTDYEGYKEKALSHWTKVPLSIRENFINSLVSEYSLLKATESTLGGIKAGAKQEEDTVEVKIDSNSGKLYVPTYPTVPNGLATEEYVKSKVAGLFKLKGSLAAIEIVEDLLIADNVGNVYNIDETFTTTANFLEGTGKVFPAGTNIVVIEAEEEIYKFDVLAGLFEITLPSTLLLTLPDLTDPLSVAGVKEALTSQMLSVMKANKSDIDTTKVDDIVLKITSNDVYYHLSNIKIDNQKVHLNFTIISLSKAISTVYLEIDLNFSSNNKFYFAASLIPDISTDITTETTNTTKTVCPKAVVEYADIIMTPILTALETILDEPEE